MASILDFLNTDKGAEFISSASEKTFVEKDKITTALGIGFPILLGAIKNYISSQQGRDNFFNILQSKTGSKNFPETIDHITSPNGIKEGENILNLITNNDHQKIAPLISSIVKVEVTRVEELLKMAVNLLAGILADQIEKDRFRAKDLESLIETAFGSSSSLETSFIETLVDKDNEGKFLDDINSMILGGGTKGKKDGGILGGMTGGK